jgi:hypothetical protein
MEKVEESNPFGEINELKALFQQQQNTANETIQAFLSSVRQLKHEYLSSLSSVPVHPYEKLKEQYWTAETKPLLIEEIEQPENFCSETCLKQISSISLNLNEQWTTQICALTCCDANQELELAGNAFASLSENVFVVDQKRAENHLRFVEMIKTIPIQLIEQQPREVAEKIVSQFINLYRI